MTQVLLAAAAGSTQATLAPAGRNKTVSMQAVQLIHNQPIKKVKLILNINRLYEMPTNLMQKIPTWSDTCHFRQQHLLQECRPITNMKFIFSINGNTA